MHGYLPDILSFPPTDALLSFVETGVVTVLDTVTLVGFCSVALVGITFLGTSVAVDDEVTTATAFIRSWNAGLLNLTDAEVRRAKSWQSLCQALFMLNEFVYVD